MSALQSSHRANLTLNDLFDTPNCDENKTIEFMFAGINMFWARLRLTGAYAAFPAGGGGGCSLSLSGP